MAAKVVYEVTFYHIYHVVGLDAGFNQRLIWRNLLKRVEQFYINVLQHVSQTRRRMVGELVTPHSSPVATNE